MGKCILPNCRKEEFSNVEVPLSSITESGKIVFPHNDKDTELNTFLPMCAYHMVLQSEFGIVTLNSDNTLIVRCPEILKRYEECLDSEMKKAIKECNKDKNKTESIRLAKIHLKAKKFAKEVKKE